MYYPGGNKDTFDGDQSTARHYKEGLTQIFTARIGPAVPNKQSGICVRRTRVTPHRPHSVDLASARLSPPTSRLSMTPTKEVASQEFMCPTSG